MLFRDSRYSKGALSGVRAWSFIKDVTVYIDIVLNFLDRCKICWRFLKTLTKITKPVLKATPSKYQIVGMLHWSIQLMRHLGLRNWKLADLHRLTSGGINANSSNNERESINSEVLFECWKAFGGRNVTSGQVACNWQLLAIGSIIEFHDKIFLCRMIVYEFALTVGWSLWRLLSNL